MKFTNILKDAKPGNRYPCPCCHYSTLDERGGYDICQVCFWEDDGQDEHDADEVRGGPNGGVSLSRARTNFLEYGACESSAIPHVRSPTEEEKKQK